MMDTPIPMEYVQKPIYFSLLRMTDAKPYQLCPACSKSLVNPIFYYYDTECLMSVCECHCGAMWMTIIADLRKEHQ